MINLLGRKLIRSSKMNCQSERGCSGMEKDNDPPPSPRREEEGMSDSVSYESDDDDEEEDQDPIEVERALAEETLTRKVNWVIDEFKTASKTLLDLAHLLQVRGGGGFRATQLVNRCREISQMLKGPAVETLRTVHDKLNPLERHNLELEIQVGCLEPRVRKRNSQVRALESQLKAMGDVTYFEEWKAKEMVKMVGLEKEVEELRAKISELEELNEEGRASAPPCSGPVPVDGSGTEPLASTSSTPRLEIRSILRHSTDLREREPAMSSRTRKDNQHGGSGFTEGIPSSGSVRKESTTQPPDGLRKGKKRIKWWGDSRKSSLQGKRFSDASMIVAFWSEPSEPMQENEMGGENTSAGVDVNEDLVGSSGEVTNGRGRQAEQEGEVRADGADDDTDNVNLAMVGIGEESGNAARTGIEDACSQGPRLVLVNHNSAGPVNTEADGDFNSGHGHGHDDNVGCIMTVDNNLAEGVAGNLDGVVIVGHCETGIDSEAGIGNGGGGGGSNVEIGEGNDTNALASTSASIAVETPNYVHVEEVKDASTSPPRHEGDETATGTIPTARTSDDGDSSGEDNTLDHAMDIIIIDVFPTNSQLDCQDGNASENGMVHGVVDTPPPPPKRTYELRRKNNIPYNLLNRDAIVASPPQELKRKQTKVVPEETPKYECSVCPKVYYSKGTYDRHVRHHKAGRPVKCPVNCPVCSKPIGYKRNVKVHMLTHEPNRERSFRCDRCNKMFFTAGSLCTHKKKHHGIRKLKCKDCPKRFIWEHQLTAHMVVHSNVRGFPCTLCDQSFKHKKTLRLHVRRHGEEKRFLCQECGKGFPTTEKLAYHARRFHDGTKAHKCGVCRMTFPNKLNLLRHGRRLHPSQ